MPRFTSVAFLAAPLRSAARPSVPLARTAAVAGLLLAGPLAGVASAAENGHSPVVELLAQLVNFGLLAGLLYLVLRSPLAIYLASRIEQVRSELVKAAETRRVATERLAEIQRRLEGLPKELEALRLRWAREVAEEEARIREVAEAEKQRLIAQARREVDLQTRIAKRLLLEEAADLTVAAAGERLRRRMTEAEQARLLDRYLSQVRAQGQGA